MVLYCTELQSLAKKIRKCREIEEISQFQQFTPQDEQCETHFQIDDRYIVRLPFKQNPPLDIRQSRLTAEHLFNSEFMHVYEALGHMRRVSDNQKSQNQSIYVRHHPIFREESYNIERIVTQQSLLFGPKLQIDLHAIILQWRHFKFVYAADITTMYRQIFVDQRDIDYQRILWKDEHAEKPSEYQMLSVTYDMTCAPFLVLRVLRSLIADDEYQFSLAVPIL
ncbi:hypothetical protein ACFW04_011390 [Cataglyphis niger]